MWEQSVNEAIFWMQPVFKDTINYLQSGLPLDNHLRKSQACLSTEDLCVRHPSSQALH